MPLASGQITAVKQSSVPLGLRLHTAWGPIEVEPQVSTVFPGYYMLILGRITLGISPKAELDRIARSKFKRSASISRWNESVGSV